MKHIRKEDQGFRAPDIDKSQIYDFLDFLCQFTESYKRLTDEGKETAVNYLSMAIWSMGLKDYQKPSTLKLIEKKIGDML